MRGDMQTSGVLHRRQHQRCPRAPSFEQIDENQPGKWFTQKSQVLQRHPHETWRSSARSSHVGVGVGMGG